MLLTTRCKMIYLTLLLSSFHCLVAQGHTSGSSVSGLPYSIQLRGTGGFQFHLKGTTNEDPLVPDQFENIERTPSLSPFFNDGGNLSGTVTLRFKSATTNQLFIGLSYDRTNLNSSDLDASLILGEALSINSITPFVGYGGWVGFKQNTFVYVFGGLSLKTYEGTAAWEGLDIKATYKDASFLRIGVGADITGFGTDFMTLGAVAYFDAGSVSRDHIELYDGDTLLDTATPTGEISLQDNQITVAINLGIDFPF